MCAIILKKYGEYVFFSGRLVTIIAILLGSFLTFAALLFSPFALEREIRNIYDNQPAGTWEKSLLSLLTLSVTWRQWGKINKIDEVSRNEMGEKKMCKTW